MAPREPDTGWPRRYRRAVTAVGVVIGSFLVAGGLFAGWLIRRGMQRPPQGEAPSLDPDAANRIRESGDSASSSVWDSLTRWGELPPPRWSTSRPTRAHVL